MLNLQKDGGRQNRPKKVEDAELVQKSKKILRIMSEMSNRIDEISGKCTKIEDLFAPILISLRTKLRENAGNSIKNHEYISGVLDISWRKSTYEVIHLAKKLKRNPEFSFVENCLIKNHLTQSFGFYQNLLLSLKSGFDFEHQLDFGFLSEGKEDNRIGNKKAVYKCLMFMGDLTRYQIDFVASEEKESLVKISKKYYLESLSVDPSYGQPFNQLAALSGSQSYGLISVYYYLRCLTAEQKFEGAEGNLKKILEKASNSKEEGNKKSVISLMLLFQNLLYEESTKNLTDLCRQTLENVISSQNFQASTHSILSLLILREKCSEKRAKVAMINAFLLAWFTHLTTKILADLTLELFGLDSMLEIFEAKKIEEKLEPKIEENGTKNNKNHRRRRRRIIDSEDDDEDNQIIDRDSDSDLDESSDESDFIDDSDDEEISDDSDVVIEDEENIISNRKMMKSFQNHQLIEAFAICCFWLMNSKEILQELKPGNVLSDRLNLLVETCNLKNEKFQQDTELENVEKVADLAFPEDKIARGMSLFETRHSKLNFDSSIQYKSDQIGLARLQQMEELKLWLCTKAEQAQVKEPEKSTELMENMAQLWLQQEVRDLENQEKYSSSYLVVDASALIHHLFAVKDILATKKFAIIVPNSVVQQLDGMKKSDGRARLAIRWLEKQFHQGNRWLRGQKPSESKPLEGVESYPKRKEKDSWHLFKTLECCNHFLGQMTQGAVTLITANEDLIKPIADSQGINVESVEAFLTKFKIAKKRGRKTTPKENG